MTTVISRPSSTPTSTPLRAYATESMRTFEDLEAEVEAEENAPPEVGFDEEADAWTEESGLVIHAPDYYGEDTLNPKVENASSSVLTPYFQIRFFNKGGDFLIRSWDCYGDALDPGQSQRVECSARAPTRLASSPSGTSRSPTRKVVDMNGILPRQPDDDPAIYKVSL